MQITLTIPQNAEILTAKGQKIVFGDEFYRKKKGQDLVINIAERFNIKPKSIFNHLAKVIGEEIKKNDLIAIKRGFLSAKKLFAENNCVLKNINHNTGEITLQIDKNDTNLVHSYFTGNIEDIIFNKLKINIEKGMTFALTQCDADWGGESFYFENPSGYFSVNEEKVKDKVVIAENLTKHTMVKCEALGALGFISVNKNDNINLPIAILKTLEDYKQIIALKKKYILLSSIDKIGVVYD